MKYLSVNYNMQILFLGVIYLFGNTGKDPGSLYPNCSAYYCNNQVATAFTMHLQVVPTSLGQRQMTASAAATRVWGPHTSVMGAGTLRSQFVHFLVSFQDGPLFNTDRRWEHMVL